MIDVRAIHTTPAEIETVATVLMCGFANRSAAWPTIADAITEVTTCSTPTHISLVAVRQHEIVGWVSAAPQYRTTGWELHPIVVAPAYQRIGVGRALIHNLCTILQSRGACVLYAWSDDESMSTSLGGINIIDQPLHHLIHFCASSQHAGGFYLKQQFQLCGVIPDANGPGKPDILFARHIS